MILVGIEIEDIEREDLYFSRITTNPDNLYFKTGDRAIVQRTNNWSNIKDGEFILIENEKGVMEGFNDSIFKVAFNIDHVVLSPLSSFVPYKSKEVMFDELETIKISGKLLGIVRSLSDEVKTESFKVSG